jgi:hypothetical protein
VLWRLWSARRNEALPRRLSEVAALGLVMCLPLALWCGYAFSTFGAVVPTTNLAKKGGALSALVPRLIEVYAVGFPVTLTLVPLIVLPRLARWRAPLAVAVMLAWPLACLSFYVADHTLVQTRYVLVSMPCVSIAILWLLVNQGRERLFACLVSAMVLAGLLVTGLTVVPHIANKKQYIGLLSHVSAFLTQRLAPDAPVAVFAIGQIEFESRHPLVDIGGITDHSVIPYIGNPAETLRWAKAHGARYYIISESPEPGARRVFAAPAPFVGWTLNRAEYAKAQPFAIYELP